MNNENLLKLINVINDEDNFFSMQSWNILPIQLDNEEHFRQRYDQEPPSCATPACIGGWAEHLSKKTDEKDVAYWLGITDSQFIHLCYPGHKRYENISRQEAIDTLENLYIIGEVKWDTTQITS